MSVYHAEGGEGTTWPVNVGPVGWRLRYGEPTRSDLLIAAWVLDVYGTMTAPENTQTYAETLLHRARTARRNAPQVKEEDDDA
jgi:hypothetical protein